MNKIKTEKFYTFQASESEIKQILSDRSYSTLYELRFLLVMIALFAPPMSFAAIFDSLPFLVTFFILLATMIPGAIIAYFMFRSYKKRLQRLFEDWQNENIS